MSYQINFTEANNPSKLPLIVQDQTLNSQTSVTFVGKYFSFAENNFGIKI